MSDTRWFPLVAGSGFVFAVAGVIGGIRDNVGGVATGDWDVPLRQVSAWSTMRVPALPF